MKLFRIISIAALVLAATHVNVYADSQTEHAGNEETQKPAFAVIETSEADLGRAKVTVKSASFENGDLFELFRYEFPKTNEKTDPVYRFDIIGEKISVRFIDEEGGERKWVSVDGLPESLPKSTVFVSTESEHYAISVPGVYSRQESYGTLKVADSLEAPIAITKREGGYTISYTFPQDETYIGEIWLLCSNKPLVKWGESAESQLLTHELSGTRRLSMEGYYFETPFGYTPGGEDVLFRHPSCYTGGSFSRMRSSPYETELGYVLMKLHAASQNVRGFYPTPCASQWLRDDFGIGPYYYDTRWNSDFASNLLDAYIAYDDPEFLERAVKYAEFYIDFAEEHSYPAGGGILVSDYWQSGNYTQTHSSLNHHLAGLNFLLRLYEATEGARYRELAERMLMGVEETRDLWVKEDGNLNYALHYDGDNLLTDYPVLTYNDLYQTRLLLRGMLGKTNEAVQYLMDSKLEWMLKNGVDGYYR